MKNTYLNIVCALPSEAYPLVQYYHLKPWSFSKCFKVYGSEDKKLIVTGVGKKSAAEGTAYLGGFSQSQDWGIWLNVGIAGSGLRPVGEGVIAHKIIDASTGKTWYPSMAFEPSYLTETITTVEKPMDNITGRSLVDMEASGFFEIALHFTETELVQCFKIVSDNQENPMTRVNNKMVIELLESNLKGIHNILLQLQDLRAKGTRLTMSDPSLSELFKRLRFTEYQKHQIKHLWMKSKAYHVEHIWMNQDWNSFKSGKQIIGYLEQKLQNIPLRLNP